MRVTVISRISAKPEKVQKADSNWIWAMATIFTRLTKAAMANTSAIIQGCMRGSQRARKRLPGRRPGLARLI